MFNLLKEYFDGAVKVISIPSFEDERGRLTIPFGATELNEFGLPSYFPRDLHSYSWKGVLRGLHFQPGMGKLIRASRGAAFIAIVDVRYDSRSFLHFVSGITANCDREQIWIPDGFAFGFYAGTDLEVQYKCTAPFDAKTDAGIRWDDPDIAIDWPVRFPTLSERDRNAPTAKEYFHLA